MIRTLILSALRKKSQKKEDFRELHFLLLSQSLCVILLHYGLGHILISKVPRAECEDFCTLYSQFLRHLTLGHDFRWAHRCFCLPKPLPNHPRAPYSRTLEIPFLEFCFVSSRFRLLVKNASVSPRGVTFSISTLSPQIENWELRMRMRSPIKELWTLP